jgi:hypothetical protein
MINVQISSPVQHFQIPMFPRTSKISTQSKLKFVLFQYSYTMDMDLYAIFETNNGDCVVSYFNVFCGGMKYAFFRDNKR